jgi:hypothetical protein
VVAICADDDRAGRISRSKAGSGGCSDLLRGGSSLTVARERRALAEVRNDIVEVAAASNSSRTSGTRR